jgi:hypothetical protein
MYQVHEHLQMPCHKLMCSTGLPLTPVQPVAIPSRHGLYSEGSVCAQSAMCRQEGRQAGCWLQDTAVHSGCTFGLEWAAAGQRASRWWRWVQAASTGNGHRQWDRTVSGSGSGRGTGSGHLVACAYRYREGPLPNNPSF